MAKALTMPTAPEAPIAPQVSIGERIHGIENRIQEIEDISGMNGVSKSRNNNRQSQSEEVEESQEEQVQSDQAARSQKQNQSQQRAQPSSRKVETPETMARDAVANGSGALTKRTTQRKNEEQQGNDPSSSQASPARNQSTVVIPPASALSNDDGRTSFEKGRAVLDEFKQLDREEAAKQSSSGLTSSTESPGIFAPTHNIGSQHGIGYWLFTLIAIGVLAFVFVKHFLIGKNSKQSAELREAIESTNSLAMKQTAIKEYSQSSKQSVKPAPPKPATTSNIPRAKPSISSTPPQKIVTLKSQPQKEDEKKGKHFEVRV